MMLKMPPVYFQRQMMSLAQKASDNSFVIYQEVIHLLMQPVAPNARGQPMLQRGPEKSAMIFCLKHAVV